MEENCIKKQKKDEKLYLFGVMTSRQFPLNAQYIPLIFYVVTIVIWRLFAVFIFTNRIFNFFHL